MGHVKRILEIEKKYDHIVASAKRQYETELQNFKEELALKEDVIKQDYKKELEKEYEKKILSTKKQGEKLLEKSKEEADYIFENAKKEAAKKFLMEAIKNV